MLDSGRVVGLSRDNGKLKKTIALPKNKPARLAPEFFEKDTGYAWGRNFQLLPDEGKLVGLWNRYYYEVDLNAWFLKYELKEIASDAPAQDAPIEGPVSATHFFYADSINGECCALNRRTLSVDWRVKVYERNGGHFKSIQYRDGQVFVLYTLGFGSSDTHLKVYTA